MKHTPLCRRRSHRLERLETRHLLTASPWHFDVNDDQNVTAEDALLIVNQLRRSRQGLELVDYRTHRAAELGNRVVNLDVDGNREVEPLDALRVINRLRLDPPRVILGFEGDTAAGMGTHRDGIGQLRMLRGRVLDSVLVDDETQLWTRTAYRDGSVDVRALTIDNEGRFRSFIRRDFGPNNTLATAGRVELVRTLSDVSGDEVSVGEGRIIESVEFVGDNAPPSVRWLYEGDDSRVSGLRITDPGGITDESIESIGLDWIDSDGNTFQMSPTVTRESVVDALIESVTFEFDSPPSTGTNDAVNQSEFSIRLTGFVEDLSANRIDELRRFVAGNSKSVEPDGVIPLRRVGPGTDPMLVGLRPDLGMAFTSEPTVRPGQRFVFEPDPLDRLAPFFGSRTAITGLGGVERFPVSQDPPDQLQFAAVDPNAFTSQWTDHIGRSIGTVGVIPDPNILRQSGSHFSSPHLGGIDPEDPKFWFRRYDTANPGEVDADSLAFADVESWMSATPGDAVPIHGFAAFQIANRAGVTAVTAPTHAFFGTDVVSVLPIFDDPDLESAASSDASIGNYTFDLPSRFWVLRPSRIEIRDAVTAEMLIERFPADIGAELNASVIDIFATRASDWGDRIEFQNGVSVFPDQRLLAVLSRRGSQWRWSFLSYETATLIGTAAATAIESEAADERGLRFDAATRTFPFAEPEADRLRQIDPRMGVAIPGTETQILAGDLAIPQYQVLPDHSIRLTEFQPFEPTIHRFIATPEVGASFGEGPAANPGQRVVVTGRELHDVHRVIFAKANAGGHFQTKQSSRPERFFESRGFDFVSLDNISPDGTTAELIVPHDAIGGRVLVLRDDLEYVDGPSLGIVPRIQFRPLHTGPTPTVLDFDVGFGRRSTDRYVVDGRFVAGCASIIGSVCEDNALAESGIPVGHSFRYETVEGFHEITVDSLPSPLSVRVAETEVRIGSEFELTSTPSADTDGGIVVRAGTRLFLDVAAIDGPPLDSDEGPVRYSAFLTHTTRRVDTHRVEKLDVWVHEDRPFVDLSDEFRGGELRQKAETGCLARSGERPLPDDSVHARVLTYAIRIACSTSLSIFVSSSVRLPAVLVSSISTVSINSLA